MNNLEKPVEEQLLKQLKILNFWITSFGILFLIILGTIGFFIYQTAMFVRDTSQRVSNFQQSTTQSIDVKSQVCSKNDSLADFLKSNNLC
ncbi:MAG: hypothetical protein ABIQ64_03910 [Candidatus Saccharimonadales bacterium]